MAGFRMRQTFISRGGALSNSHAEILKKESVEDYTADMSGRESPEIVKKKKKKELTMDTLGTPISDKSIDVKGMDIKGMDMKSDVKGIDVKGAEKPKKKREKPKEMVL